MWFLWHNREVSYRQALNITVSSRQNKLYQEKGFNVQEWESLLEDANAIRREIKAVAAEYDVEWDEKKDEAGDARVTKALRDERNSNGRSNKKKDGEDDDDDD
jgi:calcium uniporter protein, mitochondrial